MRTFRGFIPGLVLFATLGSQSLAMSPRADLKVGRYVGIDSQKQLCELDIVPAFGEHGMNFYNLATKSNNYFQVLTGNPHLSAPGTIRGTQTLMEDGWISGRSSYRSFSGPPAAKSLIDIAYMITSNAKVPTEIRQVRRPYGSGNSAMILTEECGNLRRIIAY